MSGVPPLVPDALDISADVSKGGHCTPTAKGVLGSCPPSGHVAGMGQRLGPACSNGSCRFSSVVSQQKFQLSSQQFPFILDSL